LGTGGTVLDLFAAPPVVPTVSSGASDVYGMRHWLKVIGIHAGSVWAVPIIGAGRVSVVTEVVDGQFVWDRTPVDPPGDAVSEDACSTVGWRWTESPIPCCRSTALPDPATGFRINSVAFVELFDPRDVAWRHARRLPASTVALDPNGPRLRQRVHGDPDRERILCFQFTSAPAVLSTNHSDLAAIDQHPVTILG